jgi:hypothetical protein
MSDEVRRLLIEHVDSWDKLQVVLRFVTAPGERRSAADVAQQLDVGMDAARAILEGLEASALVRRADGAAYVYDPAPAVRIVVAALAELYATDAAEVLQLISTRAIERVRGSASALLGRAFLSRKQP